MKVIHIRIDEKMIKTIEGNAAKNAIRPSRYIRSLLEKGLVFEHQMEAGHSGKTIPTKESNHVLKMAEILVENIMLTRKLIRQSVQTQEEHREILEFAVKGAREYMEEYFLSKP